MNSNHVHLTLGENCLCCYLTCSTFSFFFVLKGDDGEKGDPGEEGKYGKVGRRGPKGRWTHDTKLPWNIRINLFSLQAVLKKSSTLIMSSVPKMHKMCFTHELIHQKRPTSEAKSLGHVRGPLLKASPRDRNICKYTRYFKVWQFHFAWQI